MTSEFEYIARLERQIETLKARIAFLENERAMIRRRPRVEGHDLSSPPIGGTYVVDHTWTPTTTDTTSQ